MFDLDCLAQESFDDERKSEKIALAVDACDLLRYCRNVRPTWVKFDSKDNKESGWVFGILSTKSKKRT